MPDHISQKTVAVIGGGIGGLTAALAFARRGAQVTIYEQSDQIREFGAGLQITPNGLRALNALGLGDSIEAGSIRAQGLVPVDAQSGRDIARFDLTHYTPGYRFFHRADLIRLLHEACVAAGVHIHLGARITAESGPVLNGAPIRADVIVGADGLHSQLRAHLNGPSDPFFTGQVAWRAVIDHDDAPVARLWMGPNRHVVTYPMTQGRLNIVAVQERRDWAAEGWTHADDPANLRHVFSRMAPNLRDLLADVETVHLWGLFRHPVAQIWHQDGVALVGDAAHPTLPFMAQGANLAIEDAYVLARCCAEAPVDQALPRYQALRRGRVVRAIKAANQNATNYHLTGLRRTLSHGALRMVAKTAPGAFLGRYDWLYGHDVTA